MGQNQTFANVSARIHANRRTTQLYAAEEEEAYFTQRTNYELFFFS
jgi:hypothetical protein